MRRVAIIARGGTAPLAPLHDKEWEIWGLPWVPFPRYDRCFEIHAQSCSDVPTGRASDWVAAFNEHCGPIPVYCDPTRVHLFPNAIEYPIDALPASIPFQYLENSVAYMIALAIHERVDEIGLFGVHMNPGGPEAAQALASVAYMVGLAQGRGITVTVPPGSPLFMSSFVAGRYGVSKERRGHIFTMSGVIQNYGVKPDSIEQAKDFLPQTTHPLRKELTNG